MRIPHKTLYKLLFIFIWFILKILRLANTLVYYGISYNTSDLFGNPYLNFTLSVTVELLAVFLSYFAFEKIGRKKPYVYFDL